MPGSPVTITTTGRTILKSLGKRTSITIYNPSDSAGAVNLQNQDIWVETTPAGIFLAQGSYAFYAIGTENPERGLAAKAVTADTVVYLEEGISH